MKKYYITALTLIIIISTLLVYILYILFQVKNTPTPNSTYNNSKYEIFVEDMSIGKYNNFSEATREANLFNNSHIIDLNTGERIWTKNPQFVVIDDLANSYEFIFYSDATKYAKSLNDATVYHINTRSIVWENKPLPSNYNITAPLILQLPELPRGCEVTSLTMLLQQAGINVNKMQLANEIRKDTTEYRVIDNKIHFGNPHIGFVGDMYNFDNPGYAVYHEPMYDLLNNYLPNRAIDLTNTDFDDILYFIAKGYPVVVIINSTYSVLPDSQFQTWVTDYGEIDITYRVHSILITGYDDDFIYFNDPLNYKSFANRDDFIDAWIQMGSQALSYTSY